MRIPKVARSKFHVHLENLVDEHIKLSDKLDGIALQMATANLPLKAALYTSSAHVEKRIERLNREIIYFAEIVREINLRSENDLVPSSPIRIFSFENAVKEVEEKETIRAVSEDIMNRQARKNARRAKRANIKTQG